MRKTLWFVLSLTVVCYLAESAPAGLGTLEFDKLDTDLDELAYEVEEEDLDDFAKLLDEADATPNDATTKVQTKNTENNDLKRKNTSRKRLKNNNNVKNLKKFYKDAGIRSRAKFDDGDIYLNADKLAAQAVGIKGKEDRKYRKGTKTRGFHRVHHKDEYKKDKVIYEDDETKGTLNKIGAKANGYKIGAGVGINKGHIYHDRHRGLRGRQGYLDKGVSDKQFEGYSDSERFESDF